MKDELGDRMKSFYEDRTRAYLPRRTYTVIRIDGKAFHTYTKGLKRPFDQELIDDMNETTKHLCKSIQGVKLGYVQSDEISLVLTDFDKRDTSAWFDGNIQKMTSIAASIATSKFNELRIKRQLTRDIKDYVYGGKSQDSDPAFVNWDFTGKLDHIKMANFDARIFTIPYREEVFNYLIWRQNDATRNSISALAQSIFSHKQLNGKETKEMLEMIFATGQNWNDFPVGQKRGRLFIKTNTFVKSTLENYRKTKEEDRISWKVICDGKDLSAFVVVNPDKLSEDVLKRTEFFVSRSVWSGDETPLFTEAKELLRKHIPSIEAGFED